MKAYKFRSDNNLDFIVDIIINKRLYCAFWKDMNDPMEGIFDDSDDAFPPNSYFPGSSEHSPCQPKEIKEKIRGYRICALSNTYDKFLLWAHYANGFRGVAIEIELPDDVHLISRVQYRDLKYPVIKGIDDPDKAARDILLSKYKIWCYEGEIRILEKREVYYKFETPVKKLIIGFKTPDATIEILRCLCEKNNVELYQCYIEDDGLKIGISQLITEIDSCEAV